MTKWEHHILKFFIYVILKIKLKIALDFKYVYACYIEIINVH